MSYGYFVRENGKGKEVCNGIMEHSTLIYDTFNKDSRRDRRRVEYLTGDNHISRDVAVNWGLTDAASLVFPAGLTLNHPDYVKVTSNKAKFREWLNREGLCPETWTDHTAVRLPCILRPAHHKGGENFTVCTTQQEYVDWFSTNRGAWYASAIVEKQAEYRVFVVRGRAVWVAQKMPRSADVGIVWNHENAAFVNVPWANWPLKAVKYAIEAWLLSGLDFGAVDVICDRSRPYVLEINTAPAIESEYRLTCTAKAFDFLLGEDADRTYIPLDDSRKGGFKKFIHPAICPEAWQ